MQISRLTRAGAEFNCVPSEYRAFPKSLEHSARLRTQRDAIVYFVPKTCKTANYVNFSTSLTLIADVFHCGLSGLIGLWKSPEAPWRGHCT